MKKIPFFFAGLALIAYAMYAYNPSEFYSHPERVTSVMFDATFRDVARWATLLAWVLFFVASPISPASELQSRCQVWIWSAGFGSIFLPLVTLVLYVNPHARFNRNVYTPLTLDARAIKIEAFARLPTHPEIVILGSSRAFTLSPAYIRQQTGYDAFNMAVEGGRAGDFAVQLNFMQKSGALPSVLVIDVNQTTVDGDFQNIDYQPISLIPYMPAAMRIAVVESVFQDVINFQSISDSIYTSLVTSGQDRVNTWIFQDDGFGVRKELSHGQYVELLKITTQRNMKLYQCKLLDPSAQKSLEKLLKFAEENKIGVVLYQSPVHPEFFREAREDNPSAFDTCQKLTDGYYRSLDTAHPNVSYADLFTYESVTLLGEDGFYDAVHLRPSAAQLVVDALTSDIQNAMGWALAERH